MTYTEQRLDEIVAQIHTLNRLARAGRLQRAFDAADPAIKQTSQEKRTGEAQQTSEGRPDAKSGTLLQTFRNIGYEVSALPDTFRSNHPEVPWNTMAAWANNTQFPDSSFNLPLCQQWLRTAASAEVAILRHTGADTEIQQAVMAQNLRRTDALAEQWRNSQATPHIFLWVTVVIIGVWFSTLSLLRATPSIIESSLLAILALSCVTMVRAARPVKPSMKQFFVSETAQFHTFAELYYESIEYHIYNVHNLKLEIEQNSKEWKIRERLWALSAVFFIIAAACARMWILP